MDRGRGQREPAALLRARSSRGRERGRPPRARVRASGCGERYRKRADVQKVARWLFSQLPGILYNRKIEDCNAYNAYELPIKTVRPKTALTARPYRARQFVRSFTALPLPQSSARRPQDEGD